MGTALGLRVEVEAHVTVAEAVVYAAKEGEA